MIFRAKSLACGLALALVAACGEEDFILPGERLGLDGETPLELMTVANRVETHDPGPAVSASSWTHANGSAAHTIAHPALDGSLSRLWSQDIGEGNGRRHRITAAPVLENGVIFTLDSRATVTATTTSGAQLWSRDLTPAADDPGDASGGGVSVENGRVFVTTAFGQLTALSATNGATLWTQDFESAISAAPTVIGNRVYAVSRNELGWAVDAETGRILWQVLGATSGVSIMGGAAPASVDGELVVFPFGSGQMIAADAATGDVRWSASIVGERIGRAFSRVSDLTGDPVSAGGQVFGGNHSGRVGAVDSETGQLQWSSEFGAIGSLWRSGTSLFFVTDENRLVRLDTATGDAVWAVDLPFFTRQRFSRRQATFAHYGPVLAGGRLIVPSDDGVMRIFDPASGAALGRVPLPSGAASDPIVVGGVLYLVTENGQLHAFR